MGKLAEIIYYCLKAGEHYRCQGQYRVGRTQENTANNGRRSD